MIIDAARKISFWYVDFTSGPGCPQGRFSGRAALVEQTSDETVIHHGHVHGDRPQQSHTIHVCPIFECNAPTYMDFETWTCTCTNLHTIAVEQLCDPVTEPLRTGVAPHWWQPGRPGIARRR